MTGEVVNAIENAGFTVHAQCWGFHNVVIMSVARDGVSQIPAGTIVGYDKPRGYLPQEIIDLLDGTFGPVTASVPPTSRTPIPNDVLCELAHALTVRECAFKQIPVDQENDDETNYSDDAQVIFDDIYEIVSRVLDIHGSEVGR